MASAMRLHLRPTGAGSHGQASCVPRAVHCTVIMAFSIKERRLQSGKRFSRHENLLSSQHQKSTRPLLVKSSQQQNDAVVPPTDDNENGVSLGTVKLPGNTDLQRFQSLLFQWANSLCQGANLPLPVPLKVDKIAGGVRLGFITVGDGQTEVLVYIDCLVFPSTSGSGPIFRAIRNGPSKDRSPPGEPRIMRSLLEALKKSVEIARL